MPNNIKQLFINYRINIFKQRLDRLYYNTIFYTKILLFTWSISFIISNLYRLYYYLELDIDIYNPKKTDYHVKRLN